MSVASRSRLPRMPLAEAERRLAADPHDTVALVAIRGWRAQLEREEAAAEVMPDLLEAGTVRRWECLRCPDCDEYFDTWAEYDRHYDEEHAPGPEEEVRYVHTACGAHYATAEEAATCEACRELAPVSIGPGEQLVAAW